MNNNSEINTLSIADEREFLSYSTANPNELHFVKTDNAFTRKARLLQAIRRFQCGAKAGTITRRGITYTHPNLAVDGHLTGCNFLNSDIFAYAKQRVAEKKPYETIEENRLFNNFLSSQPMAFNLFYPLVEIVKTAEGQIILAKIITELLDKNATLNIERITEVGIEFIPSYYKHCLNDKTAMDAYFRYFTFDGKNGIIAIETKYTDILGKNQASNPTLAIKTATEREGVAHLFTETAKHKILSGEILLSQVYRNFLLTETVRLYKNLDDSLSIVLAPEGNDSNHDDEAQLINTLCDEYQYKFQVISLESFTQALIKGIPELNIFRHFHHRYLDFSPAQWMFEKLTSTDC